jgi:hypothetical protein
MPSQTLVRPNGRNPLEAGWHDEEIGVWANPVIEQSSQGILDTE